ncbi:hypothetical protein LMG7974_01862 [Campylobacter majalis]|uniref:Uncharacterized protein n=1 Tax=Campylobacter majalis TaxID=2790656 RepID=A0ABM8QA79_9BACT|nr:hypothetical protein LMG7974_01862 [Campylobacter majalis]
MTCFILANGSINTKNFFKISSFSGVITIALPVIHDFGSVKFIPEGAEYAWFLKQESVDKVSEELLAPTQELAKIVAKLNKCTDVKNKILITLKDEDTPNAAA